MEYPTDLEFKSSISLRRQSGRAGGEEISTCGGGAIVYSWCQGIDFDCANEKDINNWRFVAPTRKTSKLSVFIYVVNFSSGTS